VCCHLHCERGCCDRDGLCRGSASGRNERLAVSADRAPDEPIMAIVSLRNQRITVYDANGSILQAPVSSGQKGRETPAGIFSVIQKEAEHYSNLYDDVYMPHMQRVVSNIIEVLGQIDVDDRLTWSGIALHGGVVMRHPASHGCIRMPYDFAERLFEVTRLGMRVIVAPTKSPG
jgi:lipoprotein-anchoring transpeptidase ErfK/SrfK